MFRKILIAASALAAVSTAGSAVMAKDNGPSDPEIAHIAYTAGVIDMRYAHLALAVSDDPDVRDFAEIMLRDHKAVNDKALALLGKLNVAPKDNATSRSLLQQAAEKRAALKSLEGAAFNSAYAKNELAYHQFVNKTVEEGFIPAADNKEFKDLLGVALKTFKAHEKHAETLVEKTK